MKKIDEKSQAFKDHIRTEITALKPNKTAKFDTSLGKFKVHFNKKTNHYSIILDGHGIEEIEDLEATIQNVSAYFNAWNLTD